MRRFFLQHVAGASYEIGSLFIFYFIYAVGCAQHMHNDSTSGGNKPAEQLVEEADGFAEVFPEHKYEIVAMLQRRHHMARPLGVFTQVPLGVFTQVRALPWLARCLSSHSAYKQRS